MDLRDGDLTLRPLRPEDAEAHKAGEDDEQIRAFEFPGPASIEQVIAAIDRWQESWRTGGPVRNFGIWLSDSPLAGQALAGQVLAGNVEVNLISDARVNLSYLVFPAWRRRGIATRAARLALSYAAKAMGATSARIAALDSNPASLGVARSLGAVQVGEERSPVGGRFLVFELALPPKDAREAEPHHKTRVVRDRASATEREIWGQR